MTPLVHLQPGEMNEVLRGKLTDMQKKLTLFQWKNYRVCRLTLLRLAARLSDLDPEETREKILLNVTLVSDGSERRVCVGWIEGVGAT